MGDKMYVLLSGQATLYFKKQTEDWDKEKLLTEHKDVMEYEHFQMIVKATQCPEVEKYRHELFENIQLLKTKPSELILLKLGKNEEYFTEGKVNYKKIVDLKTGKIFGELALVNKAPRMGSIIMTKNSHMAIMNSEAFDTIFSGKALE